MQALPRSSTLAAFPTHQQTLAQIGSALHAGQAITLKSTPPNSQEAPCLLHVLACECYVACLLFACFTTCADLPLWAAGKVETEAEGDRGGPADIMLMTKQFMCSDQLSGPVVKLWSAGKSRSISTPGSRCALYASVYQAGAVKPLTLCVHEHGILLACTC